jgi:hypothetical protein
MNPPCSSNVDFDCSCKTSNKVLSAFSHWSSNSVASPVFSTNTLDNRKKLARLSRPYLPSKVTLGSTGGRTTSWLMSTTCSAISLMPLAAGGLNELL